MNTTTAPSIENRSSQTYILITAFMALFAIVGFALYGLPFFYDFMTKEYGWSRAVVTSGNAVGKLIVAPLFGFIAGWLIDKYGPRSLMMTGAFMAGTALIGLSFADSLPMFYSFYVLNALGYVFGGPLPCQVLISRWFDKNRGKAMGIAYLGIGTGGAVVPLLSAGLEKNMGWHLALITLGALIIVIAFPMAFFIKDKKTEKVEKKQDVPAVSMREILRNRNFYLLAIGSMCSIGAVGGIMQHIKLYLRDLNFSQTDAAQVMSFVLLASLAGRVLMGFLADLIKRKCGMILIDLIAATAIPLLLMAASTGPI